METYYLELERDYEYIASQLGLTYDELIELAEEKGVTPYELIEGKEG